MKNLLGYGVKAFRMIKSYGVLYFLRRAWDFIRRRGWNSLLPHQDINYQYRKWLNNRSYRAVSLKESTDCAPLIGIFIVLSKGFYLLEKAIQSLKGQQSSHWRLYLVLNKGKDNPGDNRLPEYIINDSRISVIKHDFNLPFVEWQEQASDVDYILFMSQEEVLQPIAIATFQEFLLISANLDIVYADEDEYTENGRMNPVFKPEWSPHYLMTSNYIGHPVVVRKSLLERLPEPIVFKDEFWEYNIILQTVEIASNIKRIPFVLSSRNTTGMGLKTEDTHHDYKHVVKKAMNRRGYELLENEEIEHKMGHFRLRINRRDKVSIIIPTKNNGTVLKRCLTSIQEKSSYGNYEIIVVNNGSTEPETLEYLKWIGNQENVKVLDYQKEFNFSLINNFAVQYAKGEHLLFLNDDTEVISDDWQEALLEYSQMPEVGAVGGLLLFPNGLVQHAGIVIGMRGSASHAFYLSEVEKPSYLDLLNRVRNVSAVTAACMMVKAETFARVGGFNSALKVGLNDVDLCLRLLRMGLYNLYTPYAKLIHYESLTRGDFVDQKEIKLFNEIHADFIKDGDPFYHPALSLERNDYSLLR